MREFPVHHTFNEQCIIGESQNFVKTVQVGFKSKCIHQNDKIRPIVLGRKH